MSEAEKDAPPRKKQKTGKKLAPIVAPEKSPPASSPSESTSAPTSAGVQSKLRPRKPRSPEDRWLFSPAACTSSSAGIPGTNGIGHRQTQFGETSYDRGIFAREQQDDDDASSFASDAVIEFTHAPQKGYTIVAPCAESRAAHTLYVLILFTAANKTLTPRERRVLGTMHIDILRAYPCGAVHATLTYRSSARATEGLERLRRLPCVAWIRALPATAAVSSLRGAQGVTLTVDKKDVELLAARVCVDSPNAVGRLARVSGVQSAWAAANGVSVLASPEGMRGIVRCPGVVGLS